MKIGLVGAGLVGSTTAFALIMREGSEDKLVENAMNSKDTYRKLEIGFCFLHILKTC